MDLLLFLFSVFHVFLGKNGSEIYATMAKHILLFPTSFLRQEITNKPIKF